MCSEYSELAELLRQAVVGRSRPGGGVGETSSVGLSSSIWARDLLCPCSAGTQGVSARRLPCIKWISMRAATLACRIVQGTGLSRYRFLLGEGHQGSRRGFLQVVCFSSSRLAWALRIISIQLCCRVPPTRGFAWLSTPSTQSSAVHPGCSPSASWLTRAFIFIYSLHLPRLAETWHGQGKLVPL